MVVPLVPEVFLPSSFLFDDLLLTGGETSESESPDMDSTLRFRDGLGEIVVRAMLGENAFAVDSVQLQKSVPVVYRDLFFLKLKWRRVFRERVVGLPSNERLGKP